MDFFIFFKRDVHEIDNSDICRDIEKVSGDFSGQHKKRNREGGE